jgi:hypothetical protein
MKGLATGTLPAQSANLYDTPYTSSRIDHEVVLDLFIPRQEQPNQSLFYVLVS